MPSALPDQFTVCQSPNFDQLILASRRKELIVWRNHDTVHIFLMGSAGELGLLDFHGLRYPLEIGQRPHLDCSIPAAGDHPPEILSLLGESHCSHGAIVPGHGCSDCVGLQVPNLGQVVLASGHHPLPVLRQIAGEHHVRMPFQEGGAPRGSVDYPRHFIVAHSHELGRRHVFLGWRGRQPHDLQHLVVTAHEMPHRLDVGHRPHDEAQILSDGHRLGPIGDCQ
mmetsp:Transcript_6013/g.14375  ORF Transcript_6013/g.14375 Transcript_6013/m.14375 type:complete len:224 (+) Transcript_6013:1173-1844(+)